MYIGMDIYDEIHGPLPIYFLQRRSKLNWHLGWEDIGWSFDFNDVVDKLKRMSKNRLVYKWRLSREPGYIQKKREEKTHKLTHIPAKNHNIQLAINTYRYIGQSDNSRHLMQVLNKRPIGRAMAEESLNDYFKSKKLRNQNKKAQNRANAVRILNEKDISFSTHNNGAHLIIEGQENYIDFWPGTGRWICRSGQKGFGIKKLISYSLNNI